MDATNDLDRLALQHGTDKLGLHRYTPIYHRYFNELRGRSVDLLEIGIGGYGDLAAGGESLRMWRDYFPNGQIHGLDWHDKSAHAADRIHITQGSQGDPRVITALLDGTPNQQFDIVIDDGSHRNEHVVATFMMLFQFVADGGWYVVEDTETSYRADYGGNHSWADPMTSISFFRQCVDKMNWRERELTRPDYTPDFLDLNISTIHFYHNMIFIGKGPST